MRIDDLREMCETFDNYKRENHLRNLENNNFSEGVEQIMSNSNQCSRRQACPQLPGTLLRVFIPAGAVINLLNLIELTSPSGICFIVRLPLLAGLTDRGNILGLTDNIRKAGGSVEFID